MLDDVMGCIDEIIAACVAIKRDIVHTDEFDTGERMVLNFGHTLGHAIETHSEYRHTHGQAVAIGMSMMSACFAPDEVTQALRRCLQAYALPTKYDAPIQELTAICGKDKKRKGDTLDYVVCPSIGNGRNVPQVNFEGRWNTQ